MKRSTPVPVGNKTDLDISAMNVNYAFNPATGQFDFTKLVYVIQEGEVVDDRFVMHEQAVREGGVKDLEDEILAAAASLRELVLAHHVGKQAISTVETPVVLTAIKVEVPVVEEPII